MMLRVVLGAALLIAGCGESSGDASGNGGVGGAPDVEPGPTCIAFCVRAIGACEAYSTDEEGCRDGCQLNLDLEYEHDERCGAAAEDVFLCATELSCQELYDWRDQTPSDSFPCRDEVLVFDALITERVCEPPA
jgi:hypothetical protein